MALTILYSPQFADSLEAILEFFDERNGSDLDNRYLFLSNKSRGTVISKALMKQAFVMIITERRSLVAGRKVTRMTQITQILSAFGRGREGYADGGD